MSSPLAVLPSDSAPISASQTAPETADLALGNREALKSLIRAKAQEAGIDESLALRVAFCESTYRHFNQSGEVLRGVKNSQDVGLFQINEKFHLVDSDKLGFNIYTPEGNVDYAMYLMTKDGLRHWKWSRPCWG